MILLPLSNKKRQRILTKEEHEVAQAVIYIYFQFLTVIAAVLLIREKKYNPGVILILNAALQISFKLYTLHEKFTD